MRPARFKLYYRRYAHGSGAPGGGGLGGDPPPDPPPGNSRTLAPEDFGAVGDGVTDDYDAWVKLAAKANDLGGLITVNCGANKTYLLDREARWDIGFLVDTLTRADGTTIDRVIRQPSNGVFDINWVGISSLIVNGNGSMIKSRALHYTEADIVSATDRQPKLTPVMQFFCHRCDYIEINNLVCDGGYATSTSSAAQFAPSAINTSTGVITVTAHGLVTGEALTFFMQPGTGVVPGGLGQSSLYFIIRIDADHFKLANSLANANAGTALPITSQGTGNHTLKLSIGQRYAYGLHPAACRSIKLNNSSFNNWIGDGFAPLPRYATNYTFYEGKLDGAVETVEIVNNCHFNGNGRQGISIIGCTTTFTMTGGSLNYTGFNWADGSVLPYNCPESVPPAYGMDIEPDRWAAGLVGDVVMNGVEVKGNFGGTYNFAGKKGLTNLSPRAFTATGIDTVNNRILLTDHRVPDLQRAPTCGWKVAFTTTGTLPAPLQVGVNYFPFGRDAGANPDYFSVASSLANAIAGIAIDLTDGGTGTHTVFMTDAPAWQKSFSKNDGTLEHPPRGRALRGASSLLLNMGATADTIHFNRVTIRNLDPLAFISSLPGPSVVRFQDCPCETKGGLFKLIFGTSSNRNTYAYDWSFDGGSILYNGTGGIVANTTAGLIYANFGDFSMTNVAIDLGANPHDLVSTDRIINLNKAKKFAGNTITTSYSPSTNQKLEIYLVGLTDPVSPANAYNYTGANYPYLITGP